MGQDGSDEAGEFYDPEFVPEVFVAGVLVTTRHGLVHFVGWQDTEAADGKVDKRIVVRTVVPEHAVRLMCDDLLKKLPRQN